MTSNISARCIPPIVRDNAKEKCPICFMPLSKRKKGGQTTEPLPAGTVNRVQLSPYRVVLAGVQTWAVEDVPLTKEIQAVGYVEFNERELKNVSARSEAGIDKLFVNETGQMVDSRRCHGIPLQSRSQCHRAEPAGRQAAERRRTRGERRERLHLLGIDDDQIDEILKSGKANSHLRIRSPISGHVITKYVREGQYVEEGQPVVRCRRPVVDLD